MRAQRRIQTDENPTARKTGKVETRVLLLAILCCAAGGSTARAQNLFPLKSPASSPPPLARQELIVLVDAEFAAQGLDTRPEFIEDLVGDFNAGRPVPGGLGIGNPHSARLAIPDRAAGRAADWIEDNPDTALGRLQRYVVISYPETADTEAIRNALSHNPNVESVGFNIPVELHVAPPSLRAKTSSPDDADELLGSPCGEPETTQWGTHQMNLPNAWNWAKGHGYVGLVDTGVEVGHPDLRAFHEDLGSLVFDGGNFREHLSRDVDDLDCSVDERDPFDDPPANSTSGHGTHVSGIAAATTDNGLGAAGTCWNCSLIMARVWEGNSDNRAFLDVRARGLDFLIRQGGAQVASLSFGVQGEIDAQFVEPLDCGDPFVEINLFCDAITVGEERDVLMVASSGNWRREELSFPARDPRVVGVGGVEPAAGCAIERWSEIPLDETCSGFIRPFCGSNAGIHQELVAPAHRVLSTAYTGFDHNPSAVCGDLQFDGSMSGEADGFGPCTGTSMSSPYVAGLGGIVRSINPLLEKDDVRDVMTSTASQAAAPDTTFGHGLPDAEAAVRRALGVVSGRTMTNRLTPLFSLFSPLEQVHAYTTVPSWATHLIFDDEESFDSEPFAPRVPGYDFFPGFGGLGEPPCVTTDCQPRASLFVFTTDTPPSSASPPLTPLYRMRYDSNITPACPSPPTSPSSSNRDFSLATSPQEVLFTMEDVVDMGGIGYHLDGIEGYIYAACPGNTCQPPGTVRVLRRYHASRHDFAIFAEPDAGRFPGYTAYPDAALPEVIGYAYPNVDTDLDRLIDGWELLLGTGVNTQDSDGDQMFDGDEVNVYDRSDPDPALHGYGDPCSNACPIFSDGFESGDTSQWS